MSYSVLILPNGYFSKKCRTKFPRFYCDSNYQYISSKDNYNKQTAIEVPPKH